MKTTESPKTNSGSCSLHRLVRLFAMRKEMRLAGISFRVQDEAKKEVKEMLRAIEDCRSALQVIHTWATFRNGLMLEDAPSVARLCKRVLNDLPNTSVSNPPRAKRRGISCTHCSHDFSTLKNK